MLFVNVILFANMKDTENKVIDSNWSYVLDETKNASIENNYESNLYNQEKTDELLITTASGTVKGKSFYLDDNLKEIK